MACCRKEKCTGDPIRRLGNDYLFSQLAEPNIEHLRESGVKKMVSICPHCVRTIGEDWKEFGASFPIEHHSELLARLRTGCRRRTARGKRSCITIRVTWAAIGTFTRSLAPSSDNSPTQIDPPRSRERSFCCGAGGGQMFLGEEKGKRINMERAEELAATGAGTVGVACPFCQSMFRDALAAVSDKPPKLLDIAQIAAAAILD